MGGGGNGGEGGEGDGGDSLGVSTVPYTDTVVHLRPSGGHGTMPVSISV